MPKEVENVSARWTPETWDFIVAQTPGGPDIQVPIKLKSPEEFARSKKIASLIERNGAREARKMDPGDIDAVLTDPKNVSSDKKIVQVLSRIQSDTQIDPKGEAEMTMVATNLAGRVDVAKEQTRNPQVKERLEVFKKKNVKSIANILASGVSVTRRNFLRLLAIGGAAATLAACAPSMIGPIVVPDGGGPLRPSETAPAPSATPSASETASATSTGTETAIAPPTDTAAATETQAPQEIGGVLVGNVETISIPEYKNIQPAEIQIVTDKHIQGNQFVQIDKIGVNSDPNFKTRNGEDAKTAIIHATYYALFMRAQARGFNGDFNSFMSAIKAVQDGKRDPADVQISAISPQGESMFNPGDPTKKINIIYYDQSYYPNTSAGPGKGLTWYEGAIVDSDGNLNIYIGGYPMNSCQWTGGKKFNNNIAMDYSLALDFFVVGYRGGLLSNSFFMKNFYPTARYNSAIFMMLTGDTAPPKNYADYFPNYDWRPTKFYTSAFSISPNDEDQVFGRVQTPTVSPTATP